MHKPTWPAVRAGILFFTGVLGIAYEVVFVRPPDQTVLLFLGGLCGLPAFLSSKDDAKKPPSDAGR